MPPRKKKSVTVATPKPKSGNAKVAIRPKPKSGNNPTVAKILAGAAVSGAAGATASHMYHKRKQKKVAAKKEVAPLQTLSSEQVTVVKAEAASTSKVIPILHISNSYLPHYAYQIALAVDNSGDIEAIVLQRDGLVVHTLPWTSIQGDITMEGTLSAMYEYGKEGSVTLSDEGINASRNTWFPFGKQKENASVCMSFAIDRVEVSGQVWGVSLPKKLTSKNMAVILAYLKLNRKTGGTIAMTVPTHIRVSLLDEQAFTVERSCKVRIAVKRSSDGAWFCTRPGKDNPLKNVHLLTEARSPVEVNQQSVEVIRSLAAEAEKKAEATPEKKQQTWWEWGVAWTGYAKEQAGDVFNRVALVQQWLSGNGHTLFPQRIIVQYCDAVAQCEDENQCSAKVEDIWGTDGEPCKVKK